MIKLTAQEIIMEYLKCVVDPIYCIENFLQTQNNMAGGYVDFKLFEKQKELVESYEKHQKTIATKSRQAGFTTTTAAYFAVKSVLANKKSPEKYIIITNKLDTAQKILGQVREFIEQLAEHPWLFMDIDNPDPFMKKTEDIFDIRAKKELRLKHNKSTIKAVSSGTNSSRGESGNLLFDEAAFIENGKELYTAAAPLISSGFKIFLISTANGRDPLYFPVYSSAKEGTNGFNLVEARWYMDPRYNTDLKWEKEGCETIIEKDFTLDSYKEKVDDGYKPTSTWYVDICKTYSGNLRGIAQEIDVDFLNSGGNVITEDARKTQREQNIIEKPFFEDPDYKDMWVWKRPDEVFGKRIIMSIDVASGSGADNTAIEILNVDAVDENGEQCVEQIAQYYGKISKDEVAILGHKYAEIYDAYVVIDCMGGHGDIVAKHFLDNKYKKLYYDTITNPSSLLVDNNKFNGVKSTNGRPVGFWNPAHRHRMCTELASLIEKNKIKIRSIRTLEETETWVWRNNRIDHERSAHDDSLMSLAMGMFVFNNAYGEIKISASDISANLAIFSGGSYNIVKGSRKQVEQQKTEVNKLDEKRVLPGLFTVSYGTPKNDDYGFLYGMENYGRRR